MPRIIATQELELRGREKKQKLFPDRDANESTEVGLYLGLHLVENGSVAIFCGVKDSVVLLARRAAYIFDRGVDLPKPLAVSNAEQISKLTHLAEQNLGPADEVTNASALGVLCHCPSSGFLGQRAALFKGGSGSSGW